MASHQSAACDARKLPRFIPGMFQDMRHRAIQLLLHPWSADVSSSHPAVGTAVRGLMRRHFAPVGRAQMGRICGK